MEKILIVCASGIGNTILFTPTLLNIRKAKPNAHITLFVPIKSFAEPIEGSDLVDRIEVLSDGGNILSKVAKLMSLSICRYDYIVTAFPSNRWQFNLFSFLAGGKKRITHSYNYGKIKTLSFLQNEKVTADPNLHDIDQNLNLLKKLNININKNPKQIFYISKDDIQWANNYWQEKKLRDKFVVGIHPGSGKFQIDKRWPAVRFAKLARKLVKEHKAYILIYGGPEELNIKRRIRSMVGSKDKVYIIDTNLKHTAALIRKCSCFISNDSGLMHIADTENIPLVAIFGPTDSVRTRPIGKRSVIVVTNKNQRPFLYPFYSTYSNLVHDKNNSINKVSIDQVYMAIKKLLSL